MRILLWHVHGSWTDAFVRGGHDYLLPVEPGGGPWGLGRAGRDWPPNVREVSFGDLRPDDVDVVIAQRVPEVASVRARLGPVVPLVYVEHNTPRGDVPDTRHPMADRDDVVLVHVTSFNRLMWHSGDAETVVIGHGIPDPGHRYTGALGRTAMVVNEPVRRGRVTGTDLIPLFARVTPVDVFGIDVDALPGALGVPADRLCGVGDLGLAELHDELARRRVYLHLARWTSLGLSLLEAMHLGMPVVALACTEAVTAVPPDAGVVHTDPDVLLAGLRRLVDDPDLAAATGRAARAHALEHFGLGRFLESWDDLLVTVTRRRRRTPP